MHHGYDAGGGQPISPAKAGIGITIAKIGDTFTSLNGGAFTPEDAWNMDTKTDDGLPMSGQFYGGNGYTDATGTTRGTCVSGSAGSYVYNLSNTSQHCKLVAMLQ